MIIYPDRWWLSCFHLFQLLRRGFSTSGPILSSFRGWATLMMEDRNECQLLCHWGAFKKQKDFIQWRLKASLIFQLPIMIRCKHCYYDSNYFFIATMCFVYRYHYYNHLLSNNNNTDHYWYHYSYLYSYYSFCCYFIHD